jgi:formate dehydrogenase subunit gamma
VDDIDSRAGETNGEREKSQPGNNAPFWRGVRESGDGEGVTKIPGVEKNVLIQSFVQYPGSNFTTAGEAWRQTRDDWILPGGGALLAVTLLVLAAFFMWKGKLGGRLAETGRSIERFSHFERAAHWTNAAAFVVLELTGLVMMFGRFTLLPVIGPTLFGWLAYACKTLHNVAGPVFAVSLVVIFVTFLRDNFPKLHDWEWVRRGGGFFGGEEPPSGRFNAGEKVVFWGGVFALGVVVVASGFVLDGIVPGLDGTRGERQIANMIHGVGTLAMMAMFIGHIYIGTIGLHGALRAMTTGRVDEAWAREHHALWWRDAAERARGGSAKDAA